MRLQKIKGSCRFSFSLSMFSTIETIFFFYFRCDKYTFHSGNLPIFQTPLRSLDPTAMQGDCRIMRWEFVSKRTARAGVEWFRSKVFSCVLGWPSKSPALKPIENLQRFYEALILGQLNTNAWKIFSTHDVPSTVQTSIE